MSSCRCLAGVFGRLRLNDVGLGRFDYVISTSAGPCTLAQSHVATTAVSSAGPLQHKFQNASPKDLRQLQPYRRAKRPKPWPEILLGIELNAARNRPLNKNRLNFDRQITKQIQIAVRSCYYRANSVRCCKWLPELLLQKDAWKRKENKWKNEQVERLNAEKRWALRRAIVKAESEGAYEFQSEYEAQVNKRLKKAQYLEPKHRRQRSRRKSKR